MGGLVYGEFIIMMVEVGISGQVMANPWGEYNLAEPTSKLAM